MALDVPLFVHPSSTDGVGGLADPRLGAHALSLSLGYAYEETLAVASIIMGGVLDRHPRLDICFSHGGGCVSFLAEKFEQIARFDGTVSEGVNRTALPLSWVVCGLTVTLKATLHDSCCGSL